MASFTDVEKIIATLDGVSIGERFGRRTWFVGKRAFAWERPYSKADLKRFGDEAPPDGPILALSTGDLHEKEAILAEHPECVFTIEHFTGYPAVLVQLSKAKVTVLRELVTDAWRTVS
ncbi:MAG TPA: hypothetical protein VHE83_19340 [Mycobacteriales bacterium]|nr:hypothetical protein [Mycobacteriales bacterium]